MIRPTPAGEEAPEVASFPPHVDEPPTRVLTGGGEQEPAIATLGNSEAIRASAPRVVRQDLRHREVGSFHRHAAEKALEVEDPAYIATLTAPGQEMAVLHGHEPFRGHDPTVSQAGFGYLPTELD